MITVSTDLVALRATLDGLGKQAGFATVLALTRTAQSIQAAELAEMRSVFDRPTSFTLNSLFVQPATKADPEAQVGIRDIGTTIRHYLMPQIEGGFRRHKGFERQLIRAGYMRPDEWAVPGDRTPLNSFGNISTGRLNQMYRDLEAHTDPHVNAAAARGTGRGRTGRGRKGGQVKRYFYMRDGESGHPPGIWRRIGKRKAIPFLMFVEKPRYARRFDFSGVADRAAKRFPEEFQKAFVHAVATAK